MSHPHSSKLRPGRQWLEKLQDAMETDDAVWLTAMAALGDHASPDALLDELFADLARSHATASPLYALRTVRGRAMVSKSMDTSSSTASADGDTDDAKKPPPKRPRVRNYNPKKELDGLRRSVVDLENLLALARQRRKTGRVTPMLLTDEMNTANCTPKEAMWMGVATCQYKLLRESKIQNEHLRAQVLNQMHIVRSFRRLVQRAQAGLPSDDAPRGLPSWTWDRQALLEMATQLHESVDDVFNGEPFTSSKLEMNEITSSSFQDGVVPPQTVLARGCGRRYAPHSIGEVTEQLWKLDLPKTRPAELFRLEDFEHAEDIQSFRGTLRFSATAEAKVMFVRRVRVCGASRRSIVSTSTISPNPANESPWNILGTCTKQWVDIREATPADDDEALVEVRSRTDLCKLEDTTLQISPTEAYLLQDYSRKTVAFILNRMHNKLDSMLLGSSSEVFLAL